MCRLIFQAIFPFCLQRCTLKSIDFATEVLRISGVLTDTLKRCCNEQLSTKLVFANL